MHGCIMYMRAMPALACTHSLAGSAEHDGEQQQHGQRPPHLAGQQLAEGVHCILLIFISYLHLFLYLSKMLP
jgi:hypothetical protein